MEYSVTVDCFGIRVLLPARELEHFPNDWVQQGLLADDNAIVKRISFDELMVPRHHRTLQGVESGWPGLRSKTATWLREQGLTDVDVSTHWPYGWEKSKLVETLELAGDLAFAPLLIENVYANQHRQKTIDAAIDFRYLRNGNGICEDARVISYGDFAFLRGVRELLQVAFPKPSPWEIGPVPKVHTLGVVNHNAMRACESLGKIIRLDGMFPVFACKQMGECALFAGAQHVCTKCDHYKMTNRIVTLGTPGGPSMGQPKPCNRTPTVPIG